MRSVRTILAMLPGWLDPRADVTGALATGYALTVVTAVVNILLVPVYLHSIGRVGFGLLMMLLGLSSYAAISVLWLTGGVTRGLGAAHARGSHEEFASIWAAGKWGALGGAGAVAGLVGFVLWLFPQVLGVGTREIGDLHAALALFLAQLAVAWCYSIDRVALNVSGRQTISNLLTIGQQLTFAALAYLALAANGGLSSVLAALLASHVAALVTTWLIRRRINWKLTWRTPLEEGVRRELRTMLSSQGIAFVLFGIFSLSLQADVLFVGLLGGPAVAAEFTLIWKVAEITIQGLWRVPDVFQPRIIHLDAMNQRDALSKLLARIDRLVIILSVCAGLCYAAIGPWIIELWVGANQVQKGQLPFVLAGATIVWLSLVRLPTATAFVTDRLGDVLRVMGSELILKLAATAALLPWLGALAPLVSVNVVHALGVAYGYRRVLRRVGMRSVAWSPL